MADPFANPNENPFSIFGPKPTSVATQPLTMQPVTATPATPANDNPFAAFGPQPTRAPETSEAGAFLHGAERSAIPALASLATAGAVAELGGVGGFAVGGPVGAAIGGVAGGLIGGIGGQIAVDAAQTWALSQLPEDWQDALGQSEKQRRAEEILHPNASFLGGLVPFALTMSPRIVAGALPQNATALQRIMANPATSRVFSGALMGGMELGNEAMSGQSPDWTRIGVSTAFGVVFTRPNVVGSKLTVGGARAVQGVGMRARAPEPTVAQAGDAKVMGPGVTESVYAGTHEMAPEAAMTAQQAARNEAAIAAPDLNAVVRRIEPELFTRYDELGNQISDIRARLSRLAAPTDEDLAMLTTARDAAQQRLDTVVEAQKGYAGGPEARRLRAEVRDYERQIANTQAQREAFAVGQGTETPEMVALRQQLQALDYARRDMAPEVSAAYRRAAEGTGAEMIEPVSRETVPEGPRLIEAPDIAADSAAIMEQVTREMIAAGRPTAEAEALGQLLAHRYVTRAQRLGGNVSPLGLYQREGPYIRRGDVVSRRAPLMPTEARPEIGPRPEEAPAPVVEGQAATAPQAAWDQIAAHRLARTEGQYPGSYNATTTRGGAPLRKTAGQKWEIGNVVDVGFVKNLMIVSRNEDGSFVLMSRPNAVGVSKRYEAAPHQGLTRTGEASFEAPAVEAAPAAVVAPAEPPQAAPETAAPQPAPRVAVTGIESIDPNTIAVDAKRFQFKGGGDEAGVTDRLAGVKEWSPLLGGISVVYRDSTGKNWIADGHQRVGLAKRLMAEGHPPIRMNAQVIDAKNGFSVSDARAIAAAKNIAEGTGTAVDAAKVLREAREGGVDLPPLPPRSTLVRDGRALAELSPEAFGMAVNEVVPVQQAAIVGRLVTDPAQQLEAMRLLAGVKPENLIQAEMVVRDMLASGTEMATQGTLFGEETFANSIVRERAKIADAAMKLLRKDRATFRTLIDEAQRIEGTGSNVLDQVSNEQRLSTDEKAVDLLKLLAFRAGPVSDALSEIARDLKSGNAKIGDAAQRFLRAIRGEIEAGVEQRALAGEPQPRAAGTGEDAAAAGVDRELFQRPQKSLSDIETLAGERGIDLAASESPERITLSKIVVPDGERDRGFGTAIMQELTDYADQVGKQIALTPSKDFGGSTARLKGFYQRFGFVENKGKNKDFGTRETFIREPTRDLFQPAPPPETPEFKRWFGDSKVVDAEGKPLVVYHGTSAPKFSRFKTGEDGSFFTENPKVAEEFGYRLEPVYLSLKNPLVEDVKGQSGKVLFDLIDRAKAEGFDGVIARNVTEGEGIPPHDQMVAFEPTQIKSVNNRGTFDPNDPRILMQEKRGAIRLAEGQRPTIRLFEKADASTMLHETGHQWLEELLTDATAQGVMPSVIEDAGIVRKALGMKAEQAQPTRAQHEKFARWTEQYFREGVAPSAALGRVFEQFKRWLLNIYQSLKGLGTPINDDIRGVLDRMIELEPRRGVVAAEREAPSGIVDMHETEARTVRPAEAEAALDRIEAERDTMISREPQEVQNELAAAVARADAELGPAIVAGEGEPGAAGGPEMGTRGVEPGTQLEGSGGGVPARPVVGGGAEGGREGAGVAGGDVGGGSGAAGLRTERPSTSDPSGALAPRPTDLFGRPESPFVDKAGNIRVENLTDDVDVAQAIRDAARENNDFIGDRRGVVTDGQVEMLAEALGMDVAQLNRRKIGDAFNAEQVWAARSLLVRSAEDVVARMRDARANPQSDEAIIAYAEAKARHQMIQGQVSGITAEAGRALRAFRAMKMSPEAQQADMFLRKATGRTLFQLREEVALGATLDTPHSVSRFVADSQKPNFGDMILEYWINALLSGIKTHMTNTVGNTINSFLKMGPDTAMAALIGSMRRAQGREGQTVKFGEVAAQFRALKESAGPATTAAVEGFRRESNVVLPNQVQSELPYQPMGVDVVAGGAFNPNATMADAAREAATIWQSIADGIRGIGKLIATGGDASAPAIHTRTMPGRAIPDIAIRGTTVLPLGQMLRVSTRMLAAEDSLFRVSNYMTDIAAQAYRQAAEEGLVGGALTRRMVDLTQNPTPDMMATARLTAAEQLLQSRRSAFVTQIAKLANTNIMGFRWLRLVMPFITTPANILEQAVVQRSPLGFLSPELRADLLGKNGTIAQDQAQARMVVGTALMTAFSGMAMAGYASGAGPKDPKEASLWRMAGNQAHSVRIGDTWYQINQLGPAGMLASMAADLVDVGWALEEGDASRAGGQLIQAISSSFLDATFMTGPSQLLEAVQDPDRYGGYWVQSFASSFMPYSGIMGQSARAIDPYSRQVRSTLDALQSKVPGLSQQLYPRRDIWGQPLPARGALGGSLISSVYMTEISKDPVNQAMAAAGYWPGQPQRRIRGVELSDDQYDEYTTMAGRMAKQRLDTIVNSSAFNSWPPAVKRDVIQETIGQSREVARGMMLAKYPEIVSQSVQAKTEGYANYLKME